MGAHPELGIRPLDLGFGARIQREQLGDLRFLPSATPIVVLDGASEPLQFRGLGLHLSPLLPRESREWGRTKDAKKKTNKEEKTRWAERERAKVRNAEEMEEEEGKWGDGYIRMCGMAWAMAFCFTKRLKWGRPGQREGNCVRRAEEEERGRRDHRPEWSGVGEKRDGRGRHRCHRCSLNQIRNLLSLLLLLLLGPYPDQIDGSSFPNIFKM